MQCVFIIFYGDRLYDAINSEQEAAFVRSVVETMQYERVFQCMDYVHSYNMACVRSYNNESSLLQHVFCHHLPKLRRNKHDVFGKFKSPPFCPDNIIWISVHKITNNIPKNLDVWLKQHEELLENYHRSYKKLDFNGTQNDEFNKHFPAYRVSFLCGCGVIIDFVDDLGAHVKKFHSKQLVLLDMEYHKWLKDQTK